MISLKKLGLKAKIYNVLKRVNPYIISMAMKQMDYFKQEMIQAHNQMQLLEILDS